MKDELLKNLIGRLTEIEADSSPLISCFINLENPRSNYFAEIEQQARLVERRLGGQQNIDFRDALAELKDYVTKSLKPSSKSVAIYARWGELPVFIPMQFAVPMKTRYIVDSLPHIYPLIELKDTYHRFVIVITTENEARILETTIGAVTEEILTGRPELRKRVGREWTREHYQNHKRERDQQFVREKIRIIEDLMGRKGHSHLVLAGSPKMVSRLKNALPDRLQEKLVSTVNTNPKSGLNPILLEAIHLFAAAENVESHDRVRELEAAVLSDGLGVAGYTASRNAVAGGYADMLIIDQNLNESELREHLVRLATKAGVPIETVNRSETLERLAGVGCLLRYRPNPVEPKTRNIAA